MNLQVELRPHVGKQMVEGLGEVEITHDQWMIYITGPDYKKATGNDELHAGYVHAKAVVTCPNTRLTFKTPINWLNVVHQWPGAVIDRLSTLVQAGLAAVPNADPVDVQLHEQGQTRPINVPPEPEVLEQANREIATRLPAENL